MIGTIFKTLVSVSISFLVLQFISKIYIKSSPHPHHRVLEVINKNNNYGWKQVENLNTFFENKKFTTDDLGFRNQKNLSFNEANILVFGPSSTVGWGVQDHETYPHHLQKMSQMNVLNLGQIGYSSWQGKLLVDNLINRDLSGAKFGIVAYGINDLDVLRFYNNSGLQDHEIWSRTDNVDNFSFINSLLIFKVYQQFYNEISLNYDCSSFENITQRVSEKSFIENMISIGTSLKKKGITPIFLSTMYFSDTKDTSDIFTVENNYKDIMRLSRLKNCKEALKEFGNVKTSEKKRISNFVEKFNSSLKEAVELNHWHYLDLSQVISDDKSSFVDPVHFSNEANKSIALALNQLIIRIKNHEHE